MEFKAQNQLRLLNFQLNPTEESFNNETNKVKYTQSQFNENNDNRLLNARKLRTKKTIHLSKINNPNTELEFRRICKANKTNAISNPQLNEAYREFVNAYRQITSLYIAVYIKNRTNLIIYNTESGKEEIKTLETPERLDAGTCITQLPNGELFCYGNSSYSGTTLIIDCNFRYRLLPSGKPCWSSSAIYFNRNIYCFGGYDQYYKAATLSNRFDFNKNRWVKLIPMPQNDYNCHSLIFNENILIAGKHNKNLLVYSIGIRSFSTIPYDFEEERRKILVRTERIYLIQCHQIWTVYESRIGDEYTWELITCNAIGCWPVQVYCSYNKGGFYIGCFLKFKHSSCITKYVGFDLKEKVLLELNS